MDATSIRRLSGQCPVIEGNIVDVNGPLRLALCVESEVNHRYDLGVVSFWIIHISEGDHDFMPFPVAKTRTILRDAHLRGVMFGRVNHVAVTEQLDLEILVQAA